VRVTDNDRRTCGTTPHKQALADRVLDPNKKLYGKLNCDSTSSRAALVSKLAALRVNPLEGDPNTTMTTVLNKLMSEAGLQVRFCGSV